MDFHLAIAEDRQIYKPKSFKFLRNYFPLFLIALFLPFLLFFTINSRSFNLASQADSSNDLRIWIDPTAYEMKTGETITLRIMATTASDDLMHGIKVLVPKVDGLIISPNTLEYLPAFSGRVTLGEITITASQAGTYDLSIPNVAVTTAVENTHVKTSPATIYVLPR